MTKDKLARRIVLYEWAGFGTLCGLIWMDEWLDLPCLLGAQITPFNWHESAMETLYVLLLCLLVTWFSRRFLFRIKYLEGFLSICSCCKRIRVGEQWVPLEEFFAQHSEAEFSHGLCPVCVKERYGDYIETDSPLGSQSLF